MLIDDVMASARSVSFELVEDANRVEIALQEADDHLVVEGPYTTADPAEIAALDASPGVKRATKTQPKEASK